jgi:uncharacterized surface protein with fasciclin (FAS1) repeats
MIRTRKLTKAFAALAVVGALAVPAAGGGIAGAQSSSDSAPGTIVDIAASNPDFSTLVTAVTEAGLVETLSGEGPFTVFAPTNEAFAAIPEEDLNAILADPETLTAILTYHVLPAEVLSSDLDTRQEVATVEGSDMVVKITKKGDVKVGNPEIDNAVVTTADIEASNGVIHVIDKVILPPDMA